MIHLQPYIDLTTMMVLATKDESGNPYTSNVYFKCDDNYNFYFKSKKIREHSQHIENDENVAWSILNTEKYERSDKDKKGLQFQGISKMLTGGEAEEISEKMYGKKMTFLEMMQNGHFIYRCKPSRVKIWDEELYAGAGKTVDFN